MAVPAGYWDYGWSRTLSMKAKVAYLICLAEQTRSPTGPWWTLSQLKIAKKYTNARSAFTINDALRELEKADILQVTRHWPPSGKEFSKRQPNTYRLKPLLSQAQIAKEWKALEDTYGKQKLAKAREFSGMLDRPNNRETAAGFLRAIERCGIEKTEKETRDVAELAPDNPYRNVGTVIYRLKKKPPALCKGKVHGTRQGD